ncbi:MAG: S8 family serine peptidase [Planctomycetes bacterium]|nr:S8 family serine peptidase [Planctomycetota bacterium]
MSARSARRRAFCFLCAATLAALALASRGVAQDVPVPAERVVNPERLLIKPQRGASAEQLAAAHARAGGRVVRELPQIGWQIVAVPYGTHLAARERYAAEPAIERADLDHARRLAHVPNDPYWPNHWHLQNITADLAWDTEKGDPSVVVAVMDTGLEVTHPDLAGNVWFNPGEIAGNAIDDDGNGYVDDVNGYDFAYLDGTPNDVHGHGTACAGIVAATQDNAIGVSGVAPQCRVAGIKAALDTGYFYDSANVPAFLYCADMGFKVISMSFYADDVTAAERDAVDYCWQKGLVLVGAAGNELSVIPYYPGSYEHVISVAATDGANNPTWFTNYGSWVDVAAPGVSIATTTIGGGYTTGFAGTSAACPHVAGLAGLLFAANPAATNADVRAALEDTADATIYGSWGEYTGYGKVDCDAAVDRVQGVTSGSKAARFLFAAPVGGDRTRDPTRALSDPRQSIRFFGVGFERPNATRVVSGHRRLPLFLQGRREVIAPFAGPPSPRGSSFAPDYTLTVNGTPLFTLEWDDGPGLTYAPSDVGTYNATVTGGFAEIYRVDGQLLTCGQSGGSIYCEMPVRKIAPRVPSRLDVEFTRAYSNCTGGSETLWIYDWSTWSYPYGTWVALWTRSITGSSQETVTASITSSAANYVDEEGVAYFRLTTSGAASGGLLQADAFRVTSHE